MSLCLPGPSNSLTFNLIDTRDESKESESALSLSACIGVGMRLLCVSMCVCVSGCVFSATHVRSKFAVGVYDLFIQL